MISTVWAALLVFSVTSFTVLSFFIIFKGYGELKDILRALNRPTRDLSAGETPEGITDKRNRRNRT